MVGFKTRDTIDEGRFFPNIFLVGREEPLLGPVSHERYLR
jgi:hypothetical protein